MKVQVSRRLLNEQACALDYAPRGNLNSSNTFHVTFQPWYSTRETYQPEQWVTRSPCLARSSLSQSVLSELRHYTEQSIHALGSMNTCC